jgi:hypothetical protein
LDKNRLLKVASDCLLDNATLATPCEAIGYWATCLPRFAERLTIRQGPVATMVLQLSLLFLVLGPVLAWVRTVYTRLSGTNDRAPFRPERPGNFPVAANETAADMLCCALYPRQTFPSTDLHLRGGGLVSRGVGALTIRKNVTTNMRQNSTCSVRTPVSKKFGFDAIIPKPRQYLFDQTGGS